MSMSLRGVIAGLVFAGACISAQAATLEENMMVFATEYGNLQSAEHGPEMHQSLMKMKSAAEDSKKSLPMSLEGEPKNSPKVAEYQQGMDHFIQQINVTDKLVEQGKLPEAKQAAKKLLVLRNENHRKFR